jgi:hypothetical protein
MSPDPMNTPYCSEIHHRRPLDARRRLRARRTSRALAATLIGLASLSPGGLLAASTAWGAVQGPTASAAAAAPSAGSSGGSLEAAATKAGDTGRKVAMSLIGLGFAIAAIVLSFKRDFKEAAGIFAVGLVAVLLATPAGLNLLQNTVSSLFG